ncbi:MAG TPA: sigma-54 dependent transcriptional regulator [Burkholderiales bacterium]|nr:sigma-54 dependent transcriptional regulator [Burkholderiales bacterium]
MAGELDRRETRGRGARKAQTVLVVDDEEDIRELLRMSLFKMGLGVECAGTLAEAKAQLAARSFDLCLTDMRLPDGEGLDLVSYVSQECADLPIAVITAFGSTENAVAALKAGAFDYLPKPLSLDQLRTLIKSALTIPVKAPAKAGDLSLRGSSPAIQQVRALIDKVARSQAPVYITGESGSGKELAARLMHETGARKGGPFIAVNCGAIPENLMESEFFGHRKGAFTGADADHDGFFQVASGGTLFLDEVADLPLAMQVKLLRAIQEKRVRRVGATAEDAVDVRLICATHQKLAGLVEEGRFRQDLYYRLAVIELRMPPLRDCREDVPELVEAVLARIAAASARAPRGQTAAPALPKVSAPAMEALMRYAFPGNVRELENVLERAVALSSGAEITVEDLQLVPPDLDEEGPAERGTPEKPASLAETGMSLQDYLDRVEKEAILEALGKTRFNRTAAAKLLGITFRALRYRMARLGIE